MKKKERNEGQRRVEKKSEEGVGRKKKGRAEEGRMLSVVPLSSVSSRHQREVRGLVVMTAVVMAAGLGNKQTQRRPSILLSEAAVATSDTTFQTCCCHGKFNFVEGGFKNILIIP